MRLVGEQTRDRTRRPAASCAPSLAAGPALGVAEILALQRGAGNSAVSALLAPVQRTTLSLASGQTVGDTDSASNRREDVQHVLDRLHVLWSIDNDTYARQVQALTGDPVGAGSLGPLGRALDRNSEGSIAPAVAQNVLGVSIRSSVGPGLPNLVDDVRILYTVLREEGLATGGASDDAARLAAVHTGVSTLKTRIAAGRRPMHPSGGAVPGPAHARAHARPLSAGLVTLSDDERHQVDAAGVHGFLGLNSTLQGKVQVEKTLKRAGITDPATWFGEFVQASFLGNGTGDDKGIHPELQSRLEAAEAELLADADTESYGIHVNDKLRGWRAPPDGPHSFGLAVDINYASNPAITGPTKNAVANAGLLLRHVTRQQNPINTQRGLSDPSASWGMLRQASDDFTRYIALADQSGELARAVQSLQTAGINPDNRTAEQWTAVIRADRRAAEADFRMGSASLRDLSRGFLDLDQRVVHALTRQGLTWLGAYADYQDIQHFAFTHGRITAIWTKFDPSGNDVFVSPV